MIEGGGATAESAATTTSTTTTTSRVTSSSYVKVGDRTRFTVELRPGETTIVSWKKLMKDAAKAEGSAATAAAAAATSAADVSQPPLNSLPVLESRITPGQPNSNELNDAPPANRFSAVIEKIERLYTGKDSSDEEDLGDIPDDDQYDTEDSFIDDAELDEYFEVDKSKTKHDGYFVNKGILEKISEPLESANQQPAKRRRKEVAKACGDKLDDQSGNKHMKPGKKGTVKSALLAEKSGFPASQGPLKNSEDLKVQNNQKFAADIKPSLDPVSSLRTSHGDIVSALSVNSGKQKAGAFLAKNPSVKQKDSIESIDKSKNMHKKQSIKQSHFEESVVGQQGKSGMRERIDLNLPGNKQAVQLMTNSLLHRKEGSSVKSKVNALEKSIRELEKMVAESRPPATNTQDADSSGQCVKRRLPREIKQKLAKVARLAHATNGNVSTELLNRLMGILGHLMQMRTLKRHLRIMVTTGLTAKQEKDVKFQQTKKEVIEMIKMHIPSLMSKATEIQSQGSGDLQESGHLEKTVKGQLCLDTMLEDKICDLYDIFVDGLDEDATPQVRKLYAELAELWPKGVMDNHGIKRAICRAKERKRTLNEDNKDHEKVKRKRAPASNTEETVRVESTSAVPSQSQYVDIKVVSDPSLVAATQQNRFPALTSVASTTAPINVSIPSSASISSTSLPRSENMKHEKVNNHSLIGGGIVDMGVKKKVKKRAENLMGELPLGPQKLSSHQGDDRQNQGKHVLSQVQAAPHNSSYSEFRFEPLT